MNSSQFKRVREHSLLYIVFFIVILISSSCQKGDDLIDTTSNYPIGWKSSDSFNLVAFNVKDSMSSFLNASVAPLGTVVDGNFGTLRTSFYASYQTTLTSKSFSFTSIDSVVLIIPYYSSYPKYGKADKPFDIDVYEMTEDFDTTSSTSKISFRYNPTPLGSRTNFIPNVSDSTIDGSSKVAPAIRIPLSKSFGSKLIAPGSYADDNAFQDVLMGLYVRSSGNSNTNGFVMLSIENDNKIKIYGKNSAGESITSEFTTGGSNCITSNEYLHDNTSLANSASASANSITGDNILYNCGLFGYYNKLKLPDYSTISKDKNIFRVELTLYSIDTGFYHSGSLGIMFVDSTTGREFALPDEFYGLNYLVSVEDVTLGAYKCKAYTYSIGQFYNRLIAKTLKSNYLNIYSAPLSISRTSTSKFSSFFPSRIVLGGSNNIAKPKFKIFYTEK